MRQGSQTAFPLKRIAKLRRVVTHPVTWRLLVLSLAGLVWVGWQWARSDELLGAELRDRLDRATESTGGALRYEGIEPAGATGMAVTNLRFDGNSSIEVERLEFYPSLLGLLGRQIELDSVEAQGVRVTFSLEQDEQEVGGPEVGDAAERETFNQQLCGLAYRLPNELTIRGSALAQNDPSGRFRLPTMHVPEMKVSIECRWGQPDLRVEGLAELEDGVTASFNARSFRGAREGELRFNRPVRLSDYAPAVAERFPGEVELMAISLEEDQLVLAEVAVRDLNLPIPGVEMWRLGAVSASHLSMNTDGQLISAELRQGQVELVGMTERVSARVRRAELDLERTASGIAPLSGTLELSDGLGSAIIEAQPNGQDWTVSLVADCYDLRPFSSLLTARRGSLSSAVVSGRAGAQLTGGQLEAQFDLQFSEMEGELPLLASRPLQAEHLAVAGHLSAADADRHLVVDRLDIGEAHTTLEAAVDGGSGAVSFHAELAPLEADAFLASIPVGLAPALDGVEAAGDLSASLTLQVWPGTDR
ncbi:MAG: hypothetical protein KC561_09965, partial [Myxococcales bacterium]|nr:hypothetical protein [Myxococcales bacterium]